MSKKVAPKRFLKEIKIEDRTICFHCKSTGLTEADIFCPSCAFPQGGTEKEQFKFLSDRFMKKQALEKRVKAIKNAKVLLFVLAFFNLAIGLGMGLYLEQIELIIGGVIGASIYAGLGIWSNKKPFPAILTGFFVYIVFIAINGVFDPHTLYQGIIWKILIISGFVYGYRGVKESEQLEKELKLESVDLSV